jgi:hypothetical protein
MWRTRVVDSRTHTGAVLPPSNADAHRYERGQHMHAPPTQRDASHTTPHARST